MTFLIVNRKIKIKNYLTTITASLTISLLYLFNTTKYIFLHILLCAFILPCPYQPLNLSIYLTILSLPLIAYIYLTCSMEANLQTLCLYFRRLFYTNLLLSALLNIRLCYSVSQNCLPLPYVSL